MLFFLACLTCSAVGLYVIDQGDRQLRPTRLALPTLNDTEVFEKTGSQPATLTTPALASLAQRQQQIRDLKLPVYFEENRGQFPEQARFVARTANAYVALTDRGVSIATLRPTSDISGTWHVSAIDFVSEGNAIAPVPERALPGRINYFKGSDPARWVTDVPTCSSVRYPSVTDGIDVVVTERDGGLSYDLYVSPGADLASLRFKVHGGASRIDDRGDLITEGEAQQLRQSRPVAWFADGNVTTPTTCAFNLSDSGEIGFTAMEPPGPTQVLIIDPGLTWSTYFGGDGDDEITGIDFDSGLVTVCGNTKTSHLANPPFPIHPATSNVQT